LGKSFISVFIIWIQSLIKENCVTISTPNIYLDNEGAILLVDNPIVHTWSKHFELDVHFVRDHLQQKLIQLVHLPSQHQVANVFTKPLSFTSFDKFRQKHMIVPHSHISFRGDIT